MPTLHVVDELDPALGSPKLDHAFDVIIAGDSFNALEREMLASVRDALARGGPSAREEQHARIEVQLQQSQKMETLGTLAGGFAHDFNNLLLIVLGYTEAIAEMLPPDDPVLAKLNHVRRAGQRASLLVQRILTFSRRREPALQPCRSCGPASIPRSRFRPTSPRRNAWSWPIRLSCTRCCSTSTATPARR